MNRLWTRQETDAIDTWPTTKETNMYLIGNQNAYSYDIDTVDMEEKWVGTGAEEDTKHNTTCGQSINFCLLICKCNAWRWLAFTVNSPEVGCRTECCAERSGSNVDRPSATTSVIRDGCEPDANRVRRWPIVGSNWMAVRGRQRPSWPADDAVTAPESPAADNSGARWDRSSTLRPEEPSSCENLRRTNKTVTRLLCIRPEAVVTVRREIKFC